eukprot:8016883-Alexandrium_andersonii.AAC.1
MSASLVGSEMCIRDRPTGAQSMPTGGNPNPFGSPPAHVGAAAAGVGGGGWWTPEEWAQWCNGSWRSAQQTSAPAGT